MKRAAEAKATRLAGAWLLMSAWVAVAGVASATGPYDEVVDVTGMEGSAACAAMQGALNDALGGRVTTKRVLLRGQLGTPDDPVDFSMFHNAGASGAGRRDWPYSVCHAFWPTRGARAGEGIVGGYPDPLHGKILAQGVATDGGTASTVRFREKLCHSFTPERKLAVVVSGRGQGQIRSVAACESDRVLKVEPDWGEVPDATSTVRVVSQKRMAFGKMDLYVDYDLDVHYRNDRKQGRWRHGVFADVGLACYFVGDWQSRDEAGGCTTIIMDGVHRSGRIAVHEYGRRDDDRACVPTWIDDAHLTNRPYSIIWQAFGPGVLRGSDDVRLDVVGQGDRDNLGVVAFQTWTKDWRGWRVKNIGTGLWIAGSLNDTLYDPYLTGNEFGLVIGSNEGWGAGWPRSSRCHSGFCGPFSKSSVSMTVRGGVIEGNMCGNVVMFGGYSGEIDRTFIETGAKGSPGYAGHSVLVGAGVCDDVSGRSERQGRDRRGQVCGDDLDCPGTCVVNAEAKRVFAFQWNAALVSNRGSKDWFAFMLGKGTRAEYLDQPASRVQNIRVMGRGFGGERGHPGFKPGGKGGLYFYPSDGASVLMDVDEAIGTRRADHLPPYDHYVSMATRDLDRVIERPIPGRYPLGRFPRRATCTEGNVSVVGAKGSAVSWTLRYGPVRGARRIELIEGGRVARPGGPRNAFRSADVTRPFVPRDATAWLEVTDVKGEPDALVVNVRCWEDKG